MADYETDTEPPLDPAAERLRARLVRLLMVSGLIMMLGFIAVFAAIVYKLGFWGPGAAPRAETLTPRAAPTSRLAASASISVPRGARLVSADLDGDSALLNLQTEDGGTLLLLVDIPSGTVLGRIPLTPQ